MRICLLNFELTLLFYVRLESELFARLSRWDQILGLSTPPAICFILEFHCISLGFHWIYLKFPLNRRNFPRFCSPVFPEFFLICACFCESFIRLLYLTRMKVYFYLIIGLGKFNFHPNFTQNVGLEFSLQIYNCIRLDRFNLADFAISTHTLMFTIYHSITSCFFLLKFVTGSPVTCYIN